MKRAAAVLAAGRFDRRCRAARHRPPTPANLSALAFLPHPGRPVAADGDARRREWPRRDARPILYRQAGRAGARISALQVAVRVDPGECRRGARRAAARCRARLSVAGDQHRSARHAGRHRRAPRRNTSPPITIKGGDAGIHFLSGSAAAVRQIADAIGFPYRYDADTRPIYPSGRLYCRRPRRQDQPLYFRSRRDRRPSCAPGSPMPKRAKRWPARPGCFCCAMSKGRRSAATRCR